MKKDRLISYMSEYFFKGQNNYRGNNFDTEVLKRNIGKNYEVIEFNDWIKDPSKFWHANDPISFLKPQYDWIDDTVEIIKFENINKELNNFFGEIISLPISNKSNRNHYLEYYNKQSLDIIYDKYKKDFIKFNYKK